MELNRLLTRAALKAAGAVAAILVTSACSPRLPDLSRSSGVIHLPAGTLLLHRELVIPEGAHDLEVTGDIRGTTLRAAPDFQGRALIVSKGATHLRLLGFRMVGNRALQKPIGLPANDTPFAHYYSNNGVVIENATGVTVQNVGFADIANYPVLVSASQEVLIDGVTISDSGSFSPTARNNASGGILLEEGTRDFKILHCTIRRVRGNGIWTHSFYHSPRNANGLIAENDVEDVARDAFQVGHATNITVQSNAGGRIGYPYELVDMAGWAVATALDTAGNVDHSTYKDNHFTDINGKCMDLDGFHEGAVTGNSCISIRTDDQYPFAQFGIVFNNSNPDFVPSNVTVTGNLIEGAGYGGMFLLGSHQVIAHNRFLGLNRDQCTNDRTRLHCDYSVGDPAILHSGIYLVSRAARPADTSHNEITGNEISGFGMTHSCIVAGPGASLAGNRIEKNLCRE